MSHNDTATAPRFLNAREAARCVGISTSTFYDWLARGYLPHHKMGRVIRISADDLEAYIRRTRMNELAGPKELEAQRRVNILPD
jgi:excisionase family DNA binding protein